MDVSGVLGNGNTKGTNYNAVYEDSATKNVKIEDFLNLMVAQLKNQDFMNPVDDTQFISQMATFATMQQMQDLASYSKSNYTMSLVGKEVTVAKFGIGGKVEKDTGIIEKITFLDNEYKLYVNGKAYDLSQIMEIKNSVSAQVATSKLDASNLSLFVGTTTTGSAALEWQPPESQITAQKDLTYTVYYSQNEAMDTVADVKRNGEIFGEADRKNLSAETIIGLSANTKYYVNVIVKDTDGNTSVYKKTTIKTD